MPCNTGQRRATENWAVDHELTGIYQVPVLTHPHDDGDEYASVLGQVRGRLYADFLSK
jgi:hypothetical protein